MTIGEHSYPLRVAEEKVYVRGPWEREAEYQARAPYAHLYGPRMGRYDAEATGRLSIAIAGFGREGRPESFADRKSWTLESKLPELLRELEVRAVEDEHQAIEARRQAEECQRQWEFAIERARERYAESYRAKQLDEQTESWHRARAIAAYLEALNTKYGDQPQAAAWIGWIRSHVEKIDPLRTVPKMPDVPEAKPDDLRPFLDGLNPYGR